MRFRVRNIWVVAAGLLGLVLIWLLWSLSEQRPRVQLPVGVSLARVLEDGVSEAPKGWSTNIGMQAAAPTMSLGFSYWLRLRAERVRYRIYELMGKSLVPLPRTPILDYLEPRLIESSQTSGEAYLVAKEFPATAGTNQNKWTYLGLVWGGPAQLRHERDRITLIEEGIVKNGVVVIQWRWPSGELRGKPVIECLSTNQCVVIRDTRGLVKIVPLDHLKSYVDAGLVQLPAE